MFIENVFDFGFYGITVMHVLLVWIVGSLAALAYARYYKNDARTTAFMMLLGPICVIMLLAEDVETFFFRVRFRRTFGVVNDAESAYKREKVMEILNAIADDVIRLKNELSEQRSSGNGAAKRSTRRAHDNARKRLETTFRLADRGYVFFSDNEDSVDKLISSAIDRRHRREIDSKLNNVSPLRRAG